MRKFKTRKNKNNIIIYLGLFLISIGLTINYLFRHDLINNNTLLDILISDNFNKEDINITKVDFLLKYALNLDYIPSEEVFLEEEVVVEEDEPLIYIYNTHQTEKYKSDYLDVYNISPNVLMASKMLKEYLEDLGLKVLVEENDVSNTLHNLNLKYGSSYKVSRMFMEDAKEKYPSLEYFIDLHRDSSVYNKTTTEIDGEAYVKLLFVVGLENENYEPNLLLAENLSEILKKYDEKLYRGIMKKSGKGVNGIYNQDFHKNTMLVEVGGQYNNIREVNNTLKIFAQVLYDYIKDDENE